jgi:predicted DNA-binding protein
MVRTTTVRVDTDTHARLQALSRETGRSLIETIRDATEALGRQRFAHQVADELAELRTDEGAWTAYLAEAESTSVADGIDR